MIFVATNDTVNIIILRSNLEDRNVGLRLSI